MEMCDCSREDAEKAMKMAGGDEDEAANIIFDGRLHEASAADLDTPSDADAIITPLW